VEGARQGNCQGSQNRAGKRVGSSTTARAQTQIGPNCNTSIEFVCLSNLRTSPLLTINLITKDQAAIPTLIDSRASTNFISPSTVKKLRLPTISLDQPRTVTMLDGTNPQTGKIWKKTRVKFTYNNRTMTHEFLISPIGNHLAILGIKWLEQETPEIDWSSQTLSFPIPTPEVAHCRRHGLFRPVTSGCMLAQPKLGGCRCNHVLSYKG
jgi:hypothetical protein